MPKLRSWVKLRGTSESRPMHPLIIQIKMNHPNHPEIIPPALKAYFRSTVVLAGVAVASRPEQLGAIEEALGDQIALLKVLKAADPQILVPSVED